MINKKSKDKLKGTIKNEVTQLFEAVLDYAQVACPSPPTYNALRAKILRVGNNCIRSLHKKVDRYDVSYNANGEDFIEFKNK